MEKFKIITFHGENSYHQTKNRSVSPNDEAIYAVLTVGLTLQREL